MTNWALPTHFPDGGRRWRVSTGGGWDVRWTGDGEALLYSDGERIFRVPVESDEDLRPGDPVEVYADQNLVAWDVASDGRLLVLLRTGELIRPPSSSSPTGERWPVSPTNRSAPKTPDNGDGNG